MFKGGMGNMMRQAAANAKKTCKKHKKKFANYWED